jgi:hypothetical protein
MFDNNCSGLVKVSKDKVISGCERTLRSISTSRNRMRQKWVKEKLQ